MTAQGIPRKQMDEIKAAFKRDLPLILEGKDPMGPPQYRGDVDKRGHWVQR